MKFLNTVLLFISVMLTAVVLATVTPAANWFNEYHADLQQQLQDVAPVSDVEPYGGCDEAYLYPDTPGYRWCERNGYLK